MNDRSIFVFGRNQMLKKEDGYVMKEGLQIYYKDLLLDIHFFQNYTKIHKIYSY